MCTQEPLTLSIAQQLPFVQTTSTNSDLALQAALRLRELGFWVVATVDKKPLGKALAQPGRPRQSCGLTGDRVQARGFA